MEQIYDKEAISWHTKRSRSNKTEKIINCLWQYCAILGFSHTETMWLSFEEYQELYQAYMRLFDVENMLHKTRQTYEHLIKAENEIEKSIDFDF